MSLNYLTGLLHDNQALLFFVVLGFGYLVGKVKINVKQRPGLSYPQPPNTAWVVEDTIHSAPHFGHKRQVDPCADGSCGHAGHGGLLGGLKGLLHH